MMKKLKVLLLNLVSPVINLNRFGEINENVPLAGGYLKAYAYSTGLAEEVRIDIAPQSLMNLGGDLGLISYVSEKKYDIVGFSLYQWNSLRSLYIAGEVKKRNPRVKLLAGGPEISPITEYLMRNRTLDFMIEGEGEEPFRRLLIYLLCKDQSLEEIPGLIYREEKHWIYDSPPEAMNDISKIPSPYLLEFIEPAHHRIMHLETIRGCIFNCRYCSWKRCGRNGLSFFPLEKLKMEIALARERGIRNIRLLDSSINLSKKHLKDICETISSVDKERYIEINGFIHPELIDEESVKWLTEINIKYLILGLQSTNPKALKAIGRVANLDHYLRGTSLLAQNKINFLVGIILGLPGDTPEGFRKTTDFLLENNQKKIICFPLSISPNTPLRYEADKLGIKFQKMPPNLVISTPTMDFSSLRACVRFFRKNFSLLTRDAVFEKDLHLISRKDFPADHIQYWSSIPSLTTYVRGKYPWKGRKIGQGKPLQKVLSNKGLNPITRIFLSRECRDNNHIEEMASLIAPGLSWNTLLWLQNFGAENDISSMKKFLTLISERNPSHIWHIVLDFDREITLEFLPEIAASIKSRPNLLDYESIYERRGAGKEYLKIGPTIYAIVPWGKPEFSREWTVKLSRKIPLFWSLTLPTVVEDAPQTGAGYLIDFSSESLPSQILYTLNTVKNFQDRKPRFFRNWIIQRIWSLYCLGHLSMWGSNENFLEITDVEKAVFTPFSDNFLRKSIIDWIKSRKKNI